jgi:hypothetical protein
VSLRPKTVVHIRAQPKPACVVHTFHLGALTVEVNDAEAVRARLNRDETWNSPAVRDRSKSVVVVNGGNAAQTSFFVAGTAWPASVTPYVTTASSKLAAGTPITVTGGRFSASLEAKSGTPFVGKP